MRFPAILGFVAASATLTALTARADAPPRTITLRDAITWARAHHPAARAALARARAAVARADVPRSRWLPTVGAGAQLVAATANNTTASYVAPGIEVPRVSSGRVTSAGSLAPYASSFIGIGARQEVFDFGRIAAATAVADAEVDVARERARDAELTIAFDVAEAFHAVLAARAVLHASEEAHDRARAHRDLARAGVDAGLRSPIDLTRAEAEVARFEAARVRARGGLDVARQVLAAAVGAPDLALDAADDSPIAAALPDEARALADAAERAPAVRVAAAELDAEARRTRAIAAESRPDLSLVGSVTALAGGAPPSSGDAAPGHGLVPDVPNWGVAAVLVWPLFEGVRDARVSASRAAEEARREDLAVARQTTSADVRAAWIAAAVARDVMPSAARAVDAARANYEQADARFRAGLGTSVELADAEATRADAEIQLALAAFELARARAALGRAMAEEP